MTSLIDFILDENTKLSSLGEKLREVALKKKGIQESEIEENPYSEAINELKQCEKDDDYLIIGYSSWNWLPDMFKKQLMLKQNYFYSQGIHLSCNKLIDSLESLYCFLPIGTEIYIRNFPEKKINEMCVCNVRDGFIGDCENRGGEVKFSFFIVEENRRKTLKRIS